MEAYRSDGSADSDKVDATDLHLTKSNWPKIELSQAFKQDILKAFQLFDRSGEGKISVDAVRVAFRALGYDSLANEFKGLHKRGHENESKVDFGEFLHLIEDRMLAIDDDTEIKKSFELMDQGDKGYIDLDDLRQAAELLKIEEICDDDLSAMLLGAQIKDPGKELQAQYEHRQEQARIRDGHTYKVESMPVDPQCGGVISLPGFPRLRRRSSGGQPSPDTLTVNYKQFKNLMKMTRPPVEDIELL